MKEIVITFTYKVGVIELSYDSPDGITLGYSRVSASSYENVLPFGSGISANNGQLLGFLNTGGYGSGSIIQDFIFSFIISTGTFTFTYYHPIHKCFVTTKYGWDYQMQPFSVTIGVPEKGSGVLTLNATNQQKISVNGVDYTTFPQTIELSGDTSITATGNPNRTVTLTNTQNMKQAQIGSTIYSNFPVSVTISGDTNILLSGKDDPTITIDYTNTNVPVVTNT